MFSPKGVLTSPRKTNPKTITKSGAATVREPEPEHAAEPSGGAADELSSEADGESKAKAIAAKAPEGPPYTSIKTVGPTLWPQSILSLPLEYGD